MVRTFAPPGAVLMFALALCGQDADPVKARLFAAQAAYESEWREISRLTKAWLDERETSLRKAGDLKGVGELQGDRSDFEDGGEIPKGVPASIRARHDRALRSLESAYAAAVKEYTRAKKDDHAAAAESELRSVSARLTGGPGVDLLALVNPKTHTLSGTWKLSGRALVGTSDSVQQARLLLPYEPSEEYDVEVKCRYVSGDDGLGIGLGLGNKQVLALIDCWPMEGHISGLDMMRGKSANNNVTTLKGRRLTRDGKVNTVRCSVRAGQIEVLVNQRRVISYKGSFAQFQLYRDFQFSNEKALFLFLAPGASFQFDSVRVTTVKGKGTILK